MKIEYDKNDDILYIKFSNEPIIKDVSYNWNINIGYGSKGIVEITILDASTQSSGPIWTPVRIM